MMSNTSTFSDSELKCDYFMDLVDKAHSDDEIADVITLLETLDESELDKALPALFYLAEKCPNSLKESFRNLTYSILTDPNCSRAGRKAVYSSLREFASDEDFAWNSFFIMAQCLEEPQFHIIQPVLPQMDHLLVSVYKGLIDFKWALLVLERAFAHSNGWIRLWALEKLVSVECRTMATNYNFLLSVMSGHLNSNDLFWRLLERGRLHSFLECLTRLIEGIINTQQKEAGSFVRALTTAVSNMSSPSSLFFVSMALSKLSVSRCLNASDSKLIKTIIQKTRSIQYTSMRHMTVFNFVVFYCQTVNLSQECAKEVASLTPFFSHDSPLLFDMFIRMNSVRELLLATDQPQGLLLHVLQNHRDFENEDYCSLIWVRAGLVAQEEQLQKFLELELADRLTDIEDSIDAGLSHDFVDILDKLLCILFKSSKEPTSMDHGLVQLINGYLLLRIAVASLDESFTVHIIYTGLVKRFKLHARPFVELALMLLSERDISCDRHALLVKLVHDLVDQLSGEDLKDIYPKITAYLGENPLAPLHVNKNTTCTQEKDVNKIASLICEYRLKLSLRYLPQLCESSDSLLLECINQIVSASSYSVTECYLNISHELVQKVPSEDVLLNLINATISVTYEERKSQNFLPALRLALKLCFCTSLLSNNSTKVRIMSFCEELLELARMNTPVALFLSEAIVDAEQKGLLDLDWAAKIFSLAVFGPIPKKENRVINAAYEFIYSTIPNDFEDVHKLLQPFTNFRRVMKQWETMLSRPFRFDMLSWDVCCAHPNMAAILQGRPFEVVQRTRLNAICAALKLSYKNAQFAEYLVGIIIVEINTMNLSSSRSFGLSLAHRQNTRAVSLLLLLTDHVSNEAVLDSLFTNCVDWLLDPCQQFSIKLILEWLLVKLALKNSIVRQKLLDQERFFANRRIGSVASWINMIVLLSRAREQSSIAHFVELILPWATAQNFGVRCTAMAGLRLLYKYLDSEERKKWHLLQRVVDFDGEPAGNSRRVVDNLVEDFYFGHLDPVKHHDMQTIFFVIPSKTGMPAEELLEVELLKRFNTSSVRSLSDDELFLNAPSLVYSGLSKSSTCAPEMSDGEETISCEIGSGSSTVQRKIVAKQRAIRDDCSLVVVASLVDKPNNLGGLCRTCEVFAVDTLVIADQIFASDSSFKALSMSAEKKQKIEAVRPENLLTYLEEMRKKGYTVVAAEQTTNSVALHKYSFPKKTVLLLGDEKEGVPVRLLRCVDQTVEIEQLGQTRSLNVHVSAALFIAKFVEQVLLN